MRASFPIIIILFISNIAFAQEWEFHTDSLKDDGPDVPMILGPLIEGYTPVIDYAKDNRTAVGDKYNGFRVQVVSVDNLHRAELFRIKLSSQLNHIVEVIFDAPNYKVRVGEFTDRRDAERVRRQLMELGYMRSWVVRARLTY